MGLLLLYKLGIILERFIYVILQIMKLDHTVFNTALDNMSYDDTLFHHLNETGERFFRIYQWKVPGITQSVKRHIPTDLKGYDYSKRLTGGGVVFHCPGDMVWSLGGTLTDSYFPKTNSDKMDWISTLFKTSFSRIGIDLDSASKGLISN